MKRKIIIFVTLLFVALALNGFAHNRHHKNFKKDNQRIEIKHRPIDKENFDGRKPENRPNKDFKFENHRKGRPQHKNTTTDVKDTVNGKTAMVTVGNPLNVFQLEHLQLLN